MVQEEEENCTEGRVLHPFSCNHWVNNINNIFLVFINVSAVETAEARAGRPDGTPRAGRCRRLRLTSDSESATVTVAAGAMVTVTLTEAAAQARTRRDQPGLTGRPAGCQARVQLALLVTVSHRRSSEPAHGPSHAALAGHSGSRN